jgi:hypothetical protein
MQYNQPYGVSDPNAPYVNGNPQIGLEGSIPPAASIEYPQREIVHLIEKSNIAPSNADLYQLTESTRSQFVNFANDVGSQNQLQVQLDPPLLGYTPGLILRVRVAVTNSGSSTIDAGAGPVLIKRSTGLPVVQGDLPAGGIVSLVYDGSAFQIVNSITYGAGGGGGPVVAAAIPYTVDTSAVANTIIAPFSPAITTLTPGTILLVKVANTNTGPTVINVNAIVNIPVKANGHGALVPNDIAAGDVKLFVYDGTSFWITPNVAGSAAVGHGRCYLSYAAPNLLLSPRNGNGIVINGVLYQLPSAGVTLAPGGTPGVNYIYAFVPAGSATVALEASTVAPMLNADGVMVKTGDVTRSLVGKAYVNQYGQWQDQEGFIGVLSWFNRRPKKSKTIPSPPDGIVWCSAYAATEATPNFRNYFLIWADEIVTSEFYGFGGGIGCTTPLAMIGYDGGPPEGPQWVTETDYLGGNYAFGYALTIETAGLAEGILHYATVLITVIAGTVQIIGDSGPSSSRPWQKGAALTIVTRG